MCWTLNSRRPRRTRYAAEFRKDMGLSPDDILFLQPTRVVPRKGIEHAIDLVARLNDPRCKLIVSHESGDEGDEYLRTLKEMAEQEGVDLRFVHTHVGEVRSLDAEGHRRYTLADAYSQADFITYPSLYEGFGNALLEAFYYRKPVLVNRYAIFISDIEPRGFRTMTMDGLLDPRPRPAGAAGDQRSGVPPRDGEPQLRTVQSLFQLHGAAPPAAGPDHEHYGDGEPVDGDRMHGIACDQSPIGSASG